MDLTDFLLARFEEDEEVARAAHYEGQRWYSEEEVVGRWPEICDCDCPVKYAAHRKIEAEHIATWDPARVLAECDAKRRLVARKPRLGAHDDVRDVWWDVLAILALPYADHPDYREEWRP